MTTRSAAPPAQTGQSGPWPGKILVVDDDPAEVRVLSHLLSAQGYRVRIASNGAHGLTAAQLAPPDLVLLDVAMPDLSGYEVCRQLKADARTQSVPVIFLSARDATEDKVQAFEV
ncbi:MAG: response regulator, partial [Chloroflexi bacterium]|nr:response regulator [Chloroflexota bacterium]